LSVDDKDGSFDDVFNGGWDVLVAPEAQGGQQEVLDLVAYLAQAAQSAQLQGQPGCDGLGHRGVVPPGGEGLGVLLGCPGGGHSGGDQAAVGQCGSPAPRRRHP
jgi:hypothetical protein